MKQGFFKHFGKIVVLIVLLLLSGLSLDAYGQKLKMYKCADGKWGFIEKSTGNFVIACKYDEVGGFIKYSTGSLAKVKLNGKWGYIDKTGIELVPPIYSRSDISNIMNSSSLREKAEKAVREDINRWEREKEKEKETFSYFAPIYVEQEINKWLPRGEFEKTVDWQERITAENRQAKEAELLKEAEQAYIVERSKTMSIGNITLGTYDADRELFLIKNDIYGDWLAPVPIEEAPSFRANWNNIVKKPQWVVSNDRLAFAGYKFGAVETVAASTQQTTTEHSTPISGGDTQSTSGTASTSGTPSASGATSSSGTPSVQIGHKGTSVTISGSDTPSGSSVQVGYKGTSVTISGLDNSDTDGSFQKGDKAFGGNIPLQVGGGTFISPGLGIKYLYNLSNPVRMEVSFNYIFPQTTSATVSWSGGGYYSEIKTSMWNLGVNFHFNLISTTKKNTFYPLAGISVLGVTKTNSSNQTNVSFNIGIGSDIKLFSRLYLTNEIKYMYVINNQIEGLMVTEGLIYKF